ncbi:hypothetical protein F4804DRAFT_331044 [Jackrogersella minutella]|nr:hypothetical protein F4804DRAFT_331044 [Jackrogersella minutella]
MSPDLSLPPKPPTPITLPRIPRDAELTALLGLPPKPSFLPPTPVSSYAPAPTGATGRGPHQASGTRYPSSYVPAASQMAPAVHYNNPPWGQYPPAAGWGFPATPAYAYAPSTPASAANLLPTPSAVDRRRSIDQQREKRRESPSRGGSSPSRRPWEEGNTPPWRRNSRERRGANRRPRRQQPLSCRPASPPGAPTKTTTTTTGAIPAAPTPSPITPSGLPISSSPAESSFDAAEESRLVVGYFTECLDSGADVLTSEEQDLLCKFLDVDEEGHRELVRRLVGQLAWEERSPQLTYKLAAWISIHDRNDRVVAELLGQRLSRLDDVWGRMMDPEEVAELMDCQSIKQIIEERLAKSRR